MPLPASLERELLHTRKIDMHGYRRADGLYDIEGHVTDVKTHSIHPPAREEPTPPGLPIHDMSVRMTVDDRLNVIDIVAVMDSGPYGHCPEAVAGLEALRGAQIGRGWTARVKALLGRESCTHLVELLIPMATAAYQTMSPVRIARPDVLDAAGRPVKIDSCYAYASDRPLVRKIWPAHYTGPDRQQEP